MPFRFAGLVRVDHVAEPDEEGELLRSYDVEDGVVALGVPAGILAAEIATEYEADPGRCPGLWGGHEFAAVTAAPRDRSPFRISPSGIPYARLTVQVDAS